MTKRLKGREYLYIYKTKWENRKPRSVFVRYLGPKASTSKEYIKKCVREEEEKARRNQSSTV